MYKLYASKRDVKKKGFRYNNPKHNNNEFNDALFTYETYMRVFERIVTHI